MELKEEEPDVQLIEHVVVTIPLYANDEDISQILINQCLGFADLAEAINIAYSNNEREIPLHNATIDFPAANCAVRNLNAGGNEIFPAGDGEEEEAREAQEGAEQAIPEANPPILNWYAFRNELSSVELERFGEN